MFICLSDIECQMASNVKARISSKVVYHAVIRYLHLKGKTGKDQHAELGDVYESSAPSYSQVVGEFKRDRTSLEDDDRSGCPVDVTNEEMCNKVRDMVHSGRRIQVEERRYSTGIRHFTW